MQNLIKIITAAIAFLSGLKSTNTKLKEELDKSNQTIAEQATDIEELKRQVADDAVDDAALETAAIEAREAADAAMARADALQSEIDAAQSEGDKLAAAITAEPSTPNVDGEFNVV